MSTVTKVRSHRGEPWPKVSPWVTLVVPIIAPIHRGAHSPSTIPLTPFLPGRGKRREKRGTPPLPSAEGQSLSVLPKAPSRGRVLRSWWACRTPTGNALPPAYFADGLQPLLSDGVGRLHRGGVPLLGGADDLKRRVVDMGSLLPSGLRVVGPVDLVVEVDDPTGVDHVVRRVQDAPLGQQLCVAVLGQLVVGGPAHHPALELRYGLGVQHPTQSTGGEDVALRGEDLVRLHDPHCLAQGLGLLELVGPNVGDDEPGTGIQEVFAQGRGHVAVALNGHRTAL
uniref:Uncharacterized protein n=1 Tax=uncultured marine microorganism HF4000_APKG7H23 TaxID=455551 RepID=B3T9U8_9ZZZZ|nr:hypothetical protein ALOHA_HF4000APKG7H23ctg3g22 [uncultured marine microorganism HF4000_APKG7H23]